MEKIRELAVKLKENNKPLKIAAVIIVVIAAVLVFAVKGNSDTISIEDAHAAKDTAAEESSETKAKVYVDVGGEVESPGVYEVDKDARIYEVIDKAGGLTGKADTTDLNQAEVVKDGQKIVVASKVESSGSGSGSQGTPSGASTSAAGNGLININTADSTELQKITGIGPVMAGKIITYREENGRFSKIEDLKNVSGIGDKTFAKMKNKVTI
ncbi:helix-hairpin-helix domain-containing protein [Aminicella lysinilytica]|uniref:Competence protein ComEA n=1 Tax=Aminicella lysinilytica TaxID=433323 RepID=A0A4R6PZA0_9FIRM|nr:helix-hairpin-helix domain-containing protein [Aminicella lysinilytica]NLD11395.1 competence protein ComEA [Clostridiales bacterium]TDP52300.1 competence protein ComEA [Aminicella lysinilytica]